MKKKVLIIDDENKTRLLIAKMIEGLGLDLEVNTDGVNLKTGLKAIQDLQPDIILLDIQLADGTGFELLNLVPNKNFQLIFITAHEQYAIRAIKYAALDYILKPVDIEELEQSILNAIKNCDNAVSLQKNYEALNQNSKETNRTKIVLKTQEAVYLISVDEIMRCESERNYTTFHLSDGRKILTSKTMKEYDDLLNNSNFVRCHRSHIINMNYFDRLDRTNGGNILMKDLAEVPLARASRESFMKMLEEAFN